MNIWLYLRFKFSLNSVIYFIVWKHFFRRRVYLLFVYTITNKLRGFSP
jgi:hypothetical protein